MSVAYTKTATFLFPLLNIPKTLFLCNIKSVTGYTKITNRFLNAYIGDKNINKYNENHVFLLLRNYRDVNFDSFYKELTSLHNYVEDYEVNNCLIAIFSIPENFKKDYDLLIKGKYSKISKEAREIIIKNCYCSLPPPQPTLLNMIFEKAPILREHWELQLSGENQYISLGDSEVWPIINEKDILSKEIYNKYSKITNYKRKGELK